MKFQIKRFAHLFKALFVLGILAHYLSFNYFRPRILILHSYSLDYVWCRSINEGISRILGQQTNFSIHWQYMDTKNHPSLSYKQKAGLLARNMIEKLNPSIIVAVDDDAQNFVGKYYTDHPNIVILFCGVNGDLPDYGYDHAQNVTGILERLPLPAVRDTIPFLVGHPSTQDQPIRVVNLGDMSDTVKQDEASILAFDWNPVYLTDSILVPTFKQWQKTVKELQKRADCIIISNYRQLKEDETEEGPFVSPERVISWTVKNSKIPVVGLNGFIVEDGGEIAIAASPYEQGESVANMVLKVMQGTNPRHIPVQTTKNFLVYMRDDLYKNRKVKLPYIYEAFARAINKYIQSKDTAPKKSSYTSRASNQYS